jgi:hypothetical protein
VTGFVDALLSLPALTLPRSRTSAVTIAALLDLSRPRVVSV